MDNKRTERTVGILTGCMLSVLFSLSAIQLWEVGYCALALFQWVLSGLSILFVYDKHFKVVD